MPVFEGHSPEGLRSPQAPVCWPFGTLTNPASESAPTAPITGFGGPLTPDELAQMPAALF